MIKLRPILHLFFVSLSIISCDQFKFSSKLFATSEREKYERNFSEDDPIMKQWKEDFSAAVTNQLFINDGYNVVVLNDDHSQALGYSLELKKGDRLLIETSPKNSASKIFIDVFLDSNNFEATQSEIIKNGNFQTVIENDGMYKLVIQPEIGDGPKFTLKIYTQPSLAFPVAEKGNQDIQSFWGASRDAGSRSHEGLDIFAKRGTPVIAATDGYISRTGNKGLGGKQVWLRNNKLAVSLYYAHLDSVIVNSGANVERGDTLGLVGNTGNAEGGPPHLHFGIYSMNGAVDAYPFIKTRKSPQDINFDFPLFKYIQAGSNVRKGPGIQYNIINIKSAETPLKILATDGNWYHIKTEKGEEGFVNISRLK